MENKFRRFNLPTGEKANIPEDIELKLPANSLPIDQQHFLLEIPWDDKYLEKVPKDYLDFFKFVLPYLHARTTDIHTAGCSSYAEELIDVSDQPVDARVVNIGLILHDNGWSKLSQQEIAYSLGYTGLELSEIAKDSKEKHAVVGAEVAREILGKYKFVPPLTEDQIDLICKAVRWHDKPEELARNGNVPIEMQLICDLDHLWSFTHENFWQDTVRKGVNPKDYLKNIGDYIDKYFLTPQGNKKARQLLSEREKEVDLLNN